MNSCQLPEVDFPSSIGFKNLVLVCLIAAPTKDFGVLKQIYKHIFVVCAYVTGNLLLIWKCLLYYFTVLRKYPAGKIS